MQRKSIFSKKKMGILRFLPVLVVSKIGRKCLNYCPPFNVMMIFYRKKKERKQEVATRDLFEGF